MKIIEKLYDNHEKYKKLKNLIENDVNHENFATTPLNHEHHENIGNHNYNIEKKSKS